MAKVTSKKDDSKLFAFLAVLLSVIGFLLAYIAKKDDKYVMFYAKQSLVLFFAWLIVWVASLILGLIPVLGGIVILIADVGLFILWIVGMVYAFSGDMKEIPLVGSFASKINL